MPKKIKTISSFLLCFLLIFQQAGFAQVAAELNIAGQLSSLHSSLISESFRPLHLRYLSFNPLDNNFKLLLDKGSLKNPSSQEIEATSKTLMQYFFIGLTLPNDTFWVNLRPDSPDQMIDDRLAQTDIGRIMLETDLQLKKDTASFTSPQTPEGREYWDKIYKKAEELYGTDNVTIPTLTRPWIVPGEIIIRETKGLSPQGTVPELPSAYIYKATLKVCLEQDYLFQAAGDTFHQVSDEAVNRKVSPGMYEFKDQRSRALNEYSTQLIKELIIPKLTKEVNSSKRYAALRQVYYSLILAQWFKARHKQGLSPQGTVPSLIDKQDLANLTSQVSWDKDTYFNAYKNSFTEGEYNVQEPYYTPTGPVIRSYFSGGEVLTGVSSAMVVIPASSRSPALASSSLTPVDYPSISSSLLKDMPLPAASPVNLFGTLKISSLDNRAQAIKNLIGSNTMMQRSIDNARKKVAQVDRNLLYIFYENDKPNFSISYWLGTVTIFSGGEYEIVPSYANSFPVIDYVDFLNTKIRNEYEQITIKELFIRNGIFEKVKDRLPIEREGLFYLDDSGAVVFNDITSDDPFQSQAQFNFLDDGRIITGIGGFGNARQGEEYRNVLFSFHFHPGADAPMPSLADMERMIEGKVPELIINSDGIARLWYIKDEMQAYAESRIGRIEWEGYKKSGQEKVYRRWGYLLGSVNIDLRDKGSVSNFPPAVGSAAENKGSAGSPAETPAPLTVSPPAGAVGLAHFNMQKKVIKVGEIGGWFLNKPAGYDTERPVYNMEPFNNLETVTWSEAEPFIKNDQNELEQISLVVSKEENNSVSSKEALGRIIARMEELLAEALGIQSIQSNSFYFKLRKWLSARNIKLPLIRPVYYLCGRWFESWQPYLKSIEDGRYIVQMSRASLDRPDATLIYLDPAGQNTYRVLRLNEISIRLAKMGVFYKGDPEDNIATSGSKHWDQTYPSSPYKFWLDHVRFRPPKISFDNSADRYLLENGSVLALPRSLKPYFDNARLRLPQAGPVSSPARPENAGAGSEDMLGQSGSSAETPPPAAGSAIATAIFEKFKTTFTDFKNETDIANALYVLETYCRDTIAVNSDTIHQILNLVNVLLVPHNYYVEYFPSFREREFILFKIDEVKKISTSEGDIEAFYLSQLIKNDAVRMGWSLKNANHVCINKTRIEREIDEVKSVAAALEEGRISLKESEAAKLYVSFFKKALKDGIEKVVESVLFHEIEHEQRRRMLLRYNRRSIADDRTEEDLAVLFSLANSSNPYYVLTIYLMAMCWREWPIPILEKLSSSGDKKGAIEWLKGRLNDQDIQGLRDDAKAAYEITEREWKEYYGIDEAESMPAILDESVIRDNTQAAESPTQTPPAAGPELEKQNLASSSIEPWEKLIIGGLLPDSDYFTTRFLHSNIAKNTLIFLDRYFKEVNLPDLTEGKDIILLGGTIDEFEQVAERCSPLAEKFHIVNIDTLKIKQMAKSEYGRMGEMASKKFAFYNRDISNLKGIIPDNSMALAVNIGVLEFIDGVKAVESIKEMVRILMPGGIGIVQDLHDMEDRDLRKSLPDNIELITKDWAKNIFIFKKKVETSSPLGGIDFRFLPIVTQAVGNLSAGISSSAPLCLSNVNLDAEWQQIERMSSSGIKPSPERIREYAQASSASGKISRDKDKIILCIADILRQEEEQNCETDPLLRDILVVLDSIQQPQELKEVFLGKV